MEIEKNIPIPETRGRPRKPSKYPTADMAVGDSFLVQCLPEDQAKVQVRLASHAHAQKPKKFTTRKVEGGVRMWRTA